MKVSEAVITEALPVVWEDLAEAEPQVKVAT
jgi:hypothetical protein